MPKREKVPASSGQVGEIAGALIGEMNFSKDDAKAIIGKLGAFRRDARAFFAKYTCVMDGVSDYSVEIHRWHANYQKLFGKSSNFSDLHVPKKPEGFGPMRLIVVAKEIAEWTGNKPLQGTMNALVKHFQCWQYTDDLDRNITQNDRDPRNGIYALWVKDVREADEENANKSANVLKTENHLGLTVLERMLLEADYFFEHGEHLDQKNGTICIGSRDSDGDVPSAGWDDDEFDVFWYNPTRRYSHLRSRSAHL